MCNALERLLEYSTLKGCSQDTNTTAIFIAMNGFDRNQYKCSHGATVEVTLNSIMAISFDKKIVVAMGPCKQSYMQTITPDFWHKTIELQHFHQAEILSIICLVMTMYVPNSI